MIRKLPINLLPSSAATKVEQGLAASGAVVKQDINKLARQAERFKKLKEDDLDHTIVFIINGGITGRKAGEGASNMVLNTIEKLKKGEPIVDHLSYLTSV